MPAAVDVVVIGAGQAGLSGAYFLRRSGLEHVVLDHDQGPGGAQQHRWPTLTLGTTNHVHDLLGLPVGPADPQVGAAEVVSAYYARYESHFDLHVQRPVHTSAVRRAAGGRLEVTTDAGSWAARAVINATGTWERPFVPHYPGSFAGRQLHTAQYRRAADWRGQHVVVVGGGISAVQLLSEIAEVTTTTWVTRRPPVFAETFSPADGRAAVARVEQRVRAGLPPGSVVSATGLPLTPALRRARDRGVLTPRPMFVRLVSDGVQWPDGTVQHADVILWCTGFRPSLAHLTPLNLRAPGGGIRMDGVLATRVADEPRMHLLGYGPSASTIGANRAGRAAVHEIAELLRA
ncbi:MAG: NAD(P)-binding domain-containing protein [Mycobacteriaceae bacterium]